MREVREKTKEKSPAVAHPLRNPPASFSHDLGDTLSWPAEGAEGSPLGARCPADAVEESGPLWAGTATVRGTHGCSAPAPSRTCGLWEVMAMCASRAGPATWCHKATCIQSSKHAGEKHCPSSTLANNLI